MAKKILLLINIALCTIAVGCKFPSSKDKLDNSVPHSSKQMAERATDILDFKIKEERYLKDSLDLVFDKIVLEKIAPFEYELTIDIKVEPSKIKFYKDYYVIMAIYPEDNEISLLATDRRKYGFESFSSRLKSNGNDELLVKRKIRTKLEFARAITLTVMEYKKNRKSQMLVMQNVAI